jgi:hypothetical protein
MHQIPAKILHHRGSRIIEETTRIKAGARIKTRSNEGSTIYFMERTRAISPGIAQMPRKRRKG